MTSIKNFSLFILLAFASLVNAQTGVETYIQFDAECMKMYEYEKTADYYGMAFLDFHIKISPHETFIFRVLKQDSYIEEVEKLEKDVILCQDLRLLTKDFVKAVNAGEKIAYLARPKERGYTLYTVRKVVHYHETANDLTYEDTRLAFTYEYDKINNGVDLDKSNHRQVNFLGREKLACTSVRTFASFNNAQARYSEKISFIEGIGLYKIESEKGALILKSVDSKDLSQYLQANCQSTVLVETEKKKEEAEIPEKKTKSTTVFDGFGGNFFARGETTFSPTKRENSEITTEATAVNTKVTEVPEGYHVVKEGETLYQIAKMYKTREDVLVGLNNLPANAIIDHGTLLKVVNDGTYKDPNPIFREDEKTGAKLKIHIVRQGESLWDIAKRYGTTTTNIQQLNQLEDRDKINIRQELLIERIVSSN